MINKEKVQHIAKLARLGLGEEEIKKIEKELSSILDYMDVLKKVDVSQVDSTDFSRLIENTVREDEIKKENPKKLIEAAPEKEKGFIKVKTVFE